MWPQAAQTPAAAAGDGHQQLSCQRLQHVCLQAAGGGPPMPSACPEIPVLVPEPPTPGMAASRDAASASCAAVAAFHSAWRRQDGRCRQEGCGWCVFSWCVRSAGGQAEKRAAPRQRLKQLSCMLGGRVCVSWGMPHFWLAGCTTPHAYGRSCSASHCGLRCSTCLGVHNLACVVFSISWKVVLLQGSFNRVLALHGSS